MSLQKSLKEEMRELKAASKLSKEEVKVVEKEINKKKK